MNARYIGLTAILIAALAAAFFAVGGPRHDVAAQETQKRTQDSKKNSASKTRKAACRCGKLSVTYNGPDPERITLCHCNSCQSRTGTMFSVQAGFPREKAKQDGKSTTWTFPGDSKPVTDKSCDSGGATYHFCPVCGTTVYWDIVAAPDVIGIAIPDISATQDFRLRSVRASVGDESCRPSHHTFGIRRVTNRRRASVGNRTSSINRNTESFHQHG